MPSLNVKQDKNTEFTGFPLPHTQSNEIDLLKLIDILWQAKNTLLRVRLRLHVWGYSPRSFTTALDQRSEGDACRVNSVAGSAESADGITCSGS